MVALVITATLAGCAAPPRPAPTPPEAPIEAPARAWSASALAELRAIAQAAPAQGLRSEQETLEEIDLLDLLSVRDATAARELDRMADELFQRLALAFSTGAVDPVEVDPDWAIPRTLAADAATLPWSVATGASPATVLNALLPNSPEYTALVVELQRVSAERPNSTDADGLSRETRIERLRANLERWRWLPRTLPERRLDVLVPFFELRMRDGAASTSRPIIVGARRTPTPTFTARIESITLNPSWTPPSSIANGELLPRFRRNPGAASREGFDVLDNAGRIVAPADVDWRARPFPYTLRQRPGPGNALGRLRFDVPNPHAVYPHDTSSRGLFARSDRALSHGCIRVAEPVGLAASVLADPAWDVAALESAIETGETRVVPLDAPLPIYVIYWTAAADESGIVKYADDLYRRDAPLLRALDRAPLPQLLSQSSPTQTECSGGNR